MAKVYVSSTVADLEPERRAVIDWLVQARHQPVHSYLPDSDTVRDSCLADVDGCDVYVVILGHRYGFQPPQGNPEALSITHMEYRRAREGGKPLIALKCRGVRDLAVTDLMDDERKKLVIGFHNEVDGDARAALFDDESGLIATLSAGLQQALARLAPSPLEDPQVQRIIGRLTTDKLGLEEQNAALRRELEVVREQLASAVARTVAAANAPGATPTEVAAGQALEAGDAAPAAALLRTQEEQATTSAASENPLEALAERRRAAELAREQGALAFGTDVQAALAAYMRAAEHDPEDPWTWFYIGDLQVLVGQSGKAMASYEAGRRKAEAMAQLEPESPAAQRDLSVSHNKIGDVLVAQGDQPGALAAYRKALAIREVLAARDAANTEWRRDLSVSHNKIGNVLVAQGDLPGALASYRKDLEIAEALAARDAANTEWQRDLSVSHEKIGNVLVAQGDQPGALAAYRKALAIREALAARDAANTQWQRDLSVSHEKIGDVLVAQGDLPGALASYRKDLEIAEALTARDAANTEWQRDLSVSHNKIGDVLVAQGDQPGALAAYRKALAIREALAARDESNAQSQLDLVVSCANLGTVESLTAPERRAYLERGAGLLEHLKENGRLPPNQDWTSWFAEALEALEDLA